MEQARFEQLAREGYNRIPVTRQIMADLDTPLSVYQKLADGPYAWLFESVTGGERWGRYSIIGCPARTVYRIHGHTVAVEEDGEIIESHEVKDPLAWIEQLLATFRVPRLEELPMLSGGLVGYFGYETIGYIERRALKREKPDPLGLPDILLMQAEELAVLDNLSGKLHLIVHAHPETPHAWQQAMRRLDQLEYRLRHGSASYPMTIGCETIAEKDFVSGFTREGFEQAVRQSREYIAAGDIMQVVLSQRLSTPYRARPVDVYRALRSLNPSPYMYFMDFGHSQVVGASPEILVRKEGEQVTVRPIAGTRPRGRDEAEDRALEADLLADPKEIAEHVMLIDLGRNDVGRVARTGQVTLTDNMIIERYSHVMHIVSQVVGSLKPGATAMDVLRATFPAGTVSGAPKVRAMEIIDELEPVKRGVYAGAVGYLNWWGDMDTAIAIRTAVIQDGTLHVQAGAGIVYDSVPEKEWEETMNKGRALFRAVAQASRGL